MARKKQKRCIAAEQQKDKFLFCSETEKNKNLSL